MKPIRKILITDEISSDSRGEGDVLSLSHSVAPKVREFGYINALGLWTLICKETHRFMKIWLQTIISPLVMTLLFYAVFNIGMGGAGRMIGRVPFLDFLLPGLIMMSMVQSAFVNTSSSLILSKIQGNIVDTLMPPLSPFELTIGYALGGLLRGLVVGAVTTIIFWFLRPTVAFDMLYLSFHAIMGCLMLSLLGVITGILGDKFDHLVAIQNFIVLPATFLSGTFFSVSNLPSNWGLLCYLNPFFYMIDGFRYGLTGYAEGQLWGGLASLLIVNMVLFNIAYWLFARGTRLKP